jgi:hypothetical protein
MIWRAAAIVSASEPPLGIRDEAAAAVAAATATDVSEGGAAAAVDVTDGDDVIMMAVAILCLCCSVCCCCWLSGCGCVGDDSSEFASGGDVSVKVTGEDEVVSNVEDGGGGGGEEEVRVSRDEDFVVTSVTSGGDIWAAVVEGAVIGFAADILLLPFQALTDSSSSSSSSCLCARGVSLWSLAIQRTCLLPLFFVLGRRQLMQMLLSVFAQCSCLH